MAIATAGALVVAVVAWFGLWALTASAAGAEPGLLLQAVRTALAMGLVAGIELAVFGMLPVRFLPGESVYRWSRPIWAGLFGIGTLAFVHILLNPSSGYLSDTTRTPVFTIVALLIFFGLGSVVFWAYFRFRRTPVEPEAAPQR